MSEEKVVVIDGDGLVFTPQFGTATVALPLSPKIRGRGEACIGGESICILGDEKQVSFTVNYTRPPYFTTPGVGTLTIDELASDQRAIFATAPEPVIVVGSQFTTKFQPTTPAQDTLGNQDPNNNGDFGVGTFSPSSPFVTAG